EQLAEHFNAGNRRLRGRTNADDLDFLTNLDDAALNTTGHNRTTTRDREHVFDRHQEGLVDRTLRRRDVAVDSFHQRANRVFTELLGGVFKSSKSRALDDRRVVAGEIVLRQKLANFQLNQLEQLRIVNMGAVVQEHDDGRNANLTCKQDVLSGLWH